MVKFKAGDRVVTTEAVDKFGWWFQSGHAGVVRNNPEYGSDYVVDLDGCGRNNPAYVTADMIELECVPW
jgi:hypothetical protein